MEKAKSKHIWSIIHFGIFFVLFFLYVWLWIDPSFLYQSPGLHMPVARGSELYRPLVVPNFSWSPYFLKDFLLYPGGPVECLSALLSQYYYYAWAGALIITAVAALLGWATDTFMTGVTGVRVPVMRFIPGIFVLVICSQYAHLLETLIAVLVAMLAVCVYLRTAHHSSGLRAAVFLSLSGAVYYIAGGAYLLYAVLCGIFELRSKRGRILGLGYLLSAEIIPFVFGKYVLDLSLADAYIRLLPCHPSEKLWTLMRGQVAAFILYLFLPLAALGGALWQRVASKQHFAPASKPIAQNGKSSRLRRFWEFFRNLKAKPGLELTVMLIVAVITVLLSFVSSDKTLLRINRFADQKMWPQVLEVARTLPYKRYTFVAVHTINRALYETGKLPDEMFSYPQEPGYFMLDWGRLRPSYIFQLEDISLQLGLVSESQYYACNALGEYGDHPLILKWLALINIAKGQTEAAKVFLRALSGYSHYRGWAKDALRRLETDPLWSTDPQIEHIRSVMVPRCPANFGLFLQTLSAENEFDELLQRNRGNRMAFEYKMAYYLLNRQLENFVDALDCLDNFDYPTIPRHYEEAIAIYEYLSGEKIDLHGQQINPQMRQTCREFFESLAPYDVFDRQKASEELGGRFGDTYFFYYLFGQSKGAHR